MSISGSVARGVGLISLFVIGGVIFLLGLGMIEASNGNSFLGGVAVVSGFILMAYAVVRAEMKRRKHVRSLNKGKGD